MRLIDLSIRNFRGFGGGCDPIRLDRDLVLFFGPNGFGKTSIAEAIEWLFYGFTKRRIQGESYSRNEYAGTYANAHGGQPVEVAATVEFNSKRYHLARRLFDTSRGEGSETFVDGSPGHFSSIGLRVVEAIYPVVAQHGLQAFIHTKPKDRRDAIGAALGLDELTTLKSSLEGARLAFQRTPPTAVAQARRDLGANTAVLSQISVVTPLVERWRKSPMQVLLPEDTEILMKASAALCGVASVTTDEALSALRERRSAVSRPRPNSRVMNRQIAFASRFRVDRGAERIELLTEGVFCQK